MKPTLRTYLAISLALMLALTGQSMAVARGSTGPAGQMVLCTGTGPVMVYVDENGAPTGPPVFCPDYAQTLLTAVAQPTKVALARIAKPVVLPVLSAHVRGGRATGRAMARAPPCMV